GVEFLRFVAALYGQEGAAVERRIAELLEVFELVSWKDELVEAYSHGMRQKLIISSALIHRPQCIVVDEPMVGLDPKAARQLKDIFRQFVGRGGTRHPQRGHGRSVGRPTARRPTARAGDRGPEQLWREPTGGATARALPPTGEVQEQALGAPVAGAVLPPTRASRSCS